MSAAVAPWLASGVVTLAGSITVAVLAWGLSRRTEHDRWLRDQRLRAYTALAVAARELVRTSKELAAAAKRSFVDPTDGESGSREARLDRLTNLVSASGGASLEALQQQGDAFAKFREATGAAELVASPEVLKAVATMRRLALDVAEVDDLSDGDALDRSLAAFIATARAEIQQ